MSIELVDINKTTEKVSHSDQYGWFPAFYLCRVIEHSAQEVGIIDNLPRVYSR